MSDPTPGPKDVLANYRETAPPQIAEQVKMFNGLSGKDKMELLFHMSMVQQGMVQSIYDALAEAGNAAPKSSLILPGRMQ